MFSDDCDELVRDEEDLVADVEEAEVAGRQTEQKKRGWEELC
jgi:hypothetical protein